MLVVALVSSPLAQLSPVRPQVCFSFFNMYFFWVFIDNTNLESRIIIYTELSLAEPQPEPPPELHLHLNLVVSSWTDV